MGLMFTRAMLAILLQAFTTAAAANMRHDQHSRKLMRGGRFGGGFRARPRVLPIGGGVGRRNNCDVNGNCDRNGNGVSGGTIAIIVACIVGALLLLCLTALCYSRMMKRRRAANGHGGSKPSTDAAHDNAAPYGNTQTNGTYGGQAAAQDSSAYPDAATFANAGTGKQDAGGAHGNSGGGAGAQTGDTPAYGTPVTGNGYQSGVDGTGGGGSYPPPYGGGGATPGGYGQPQHAGTQSAAPPQAGGYAGSYPAAAPPAAYGPSV